MRSAVLLAHDTRCFDFVVSDVIMPEICGPELVRKITWMCPHTAVVLMSAHVASEGVPEGVAFISKPFQMTDLYSIVEKKLGFRSGAAPETVAAQESID
jgi:two-component system, cell cycle sensor histidine kinase and response regulator CckA